MSELGLKNDAVDKGFREVEKNKLASDRGSVYKLKTKAYFIENK